MMKSSQIRHLLARIGLAIVLIVFGIWEIMNPLQWAAYLPGFLTNFSPTLLIYLHGTALIVIGIAVLVGFQLRIAAMLACLMLLGVIVSLITLTGYDDIVVRDVGTLFLALTLVFDEERFLTVTK
jgi:uncharacterized membrane protein YphA (DoxX/SURF4 family)